MDWYFRRATVLPASGVRGNAGGAGSRNKVGIPAYVLASLVGYRMMDTGDHWASDVVFGATLGWVVGHTVAGRHKKLEVAGFEVSPYLANSGAAAMGVSLVKRF